MLLQPLKLSFALVTLSTPTICEAAGPDYVGIGGLIIYGGLLLLGLAVLVIVAMVRRSKASLYLLLGYISIPLIFIAHSEIKRKMHFRAIAQGEAENIEAYAKFCKERNKQTPLIHAKAVIAANAALIVRMEKHHTTLRLMQNPGYAIAEIMWSRKDLRNQSGVRYFEDLYYKNAYAEALCNPKYCWSVEGWPESHKPVARSQYELILGETGSTMAAPWPQSHPMKLSKSSVRIIDKLTGATLAEDTLYYLGGNTGLNVCPYAPEQMANLLAEVFGPPER